MVQPNISTPPQTNLPPKPETNPVIPSPLPKFSPPLIATFVLLVIIGALGGFFLGKSLTQPKPTPIPPIAEITPTPTQPIPTPTPDPTANWKTYTSDQLNFQIKHPENMGVDCTNNTSNTCVVKIINSIGAPGFEEFFLTFYNKEDPTEKNPEVEKQKKLLEMKIGETKQVCELPAPTSCIYKRINDFNGLVNFRVFENYHPWEGPGDLQMILINEGKDRNTEVIFSYDNGSQRNGNLTKELFYLILSTFKFLDPTANWKTYISNKYGYSIKYPQSWILKENGEGEVVTIESLKGISISQTANPAEDEKTNGFFNIIVRENSNNLSLKNWFDENETCGSTQFGCAPDSPKFSHSSIINGKETLIADQNLPGPLGEAIKVYYFAHDKNVYEFLFFFPEEETSRQLFENIYNQILSTFKFLE